MCFHSYHTVQYCAQNKYLKKYWEKTKFWLDSCLEKSSLFHQSFSICDGNDAHKTLFSIQLTKICQKCGQSYNKRGRFSRNNPKIQLFEVFFSGCIWANPIILHPFLLPSNFIIWKINLNGFIFFRFYIPTTFNEICAFVWCFKHRVWIKAINVKKNYIRLLNNVPKHFSQIKYGVVLTNKINASNSRHFSNEPRKQLLSSQYFWKKKKEIMHIHTCGVVEKRMREILNNINIERGRGVSVCYWLRSAEPF